MGLNIRVYPGGTIDVSGKLYKVYVYLPSNLGEGYAICEEGKIFKDDAFEVVNLLGDLSDCLEKDKEMWMSNRLHLIKTIHKRKTNIVYN